MGWEDAPIVDAAAAPAAPKQPWEDAPIVAPAAGPRMASGMGDAWKAGYQGSIGGLADREKLPDIVLDPQHAKWYEKLAAGTSQLVNELPEMITGAYSGGAAGGAIGGLAGTVALPGIGTVSGAGVGAVIGGGAGAFAVPTAIRTSLMQAYEKGSVQSTADFLGRAAIVAKATGKDALVGALTSATGGVAGKIVAPLAAGGVAAKIGAGAAVAGAEVGTMTTASAALEGHLPQPEDFVNGAILVAGVKGAGLAAGRLRQVYAETGIKPEQVVADAQKDPTIAADLTEPTPTADLTPVKAVEFKPAQIEDSHGNAREGLAATFDNGHGSEGGMDLAIEGGRLFPTWVDNGLPFGKGSGGAVTHVYEQAIAEAQARGLQFTSDSSVTTLASRVYDTLAKRGYTVEKNPNARLAEPPEVITARWMTDDGSPVYTVQPKAEPAALARDAKAELAAATAKLPEGVTIKETASGFEAVNAAGERVGYLNDNLKRGQAAQIDENANVSSVGVEPAFKGQGVGRALYAAFYEKHDGRVLPSGQTTAEAWAVWKRNYPERVEPFVEAEAQRIRDGADPGLVLGNITDAEIKTRVAEAAQAERVNSEIPRAYQAEALRTSINDIVPTEKAEAVAKQPFGPVTQAAGEPANPREVNYNAMHTTEQAKGAMAQLSAYYEAEITTQRRGTVSWEQTQAEAGQHIADLLGSTTPFQPRQPGAAAGAAELLARKQMLQGAAEDMATKAREYLATPAEARTPHQTAEYLASIERAAMIQAEFLGARAEAGRALNILKETKITADRAQAIQDLLARYGHDPAELARMVSELDNATAALKFAKDAAKTTTWEKLVEAWKAGLVSGPITQLANAMSNLSFAAMRPAVDGVAAAFGVLTRAPDRVSFTEPLARVLGNIQGAFDGMRMARVAFMEDAPAGKADQFRQAIPGTVGYIVRTPFRALSAMDELFRSMAERGEAYSIAARQASAEGYNPATAEFRQRVVEVANNLTPEQAKSVADTGERLVFQARLGEKGRAVQDFVKKWHLEWAVPFISTPANVFKEMARLTPAAPIVAEWRAAVAKGGPEAQKALAEVAIGTGVSILATSWALSGNVSGSGDPDPNKRRAAMAAGWQPYSIKINDTWYSYQRVQPLGTLIGMAADMASVWEHMTPEESDKLPKILATAFANSVTNQTFLQGITSVVQVMADPQRYGPKFINGMAGSLVPAVIGQPAQLLDPYQREVGSALEAIKNRIPVVREGLTPTRDIFGEPQANPDRVGGISPITERTLSDDPVRKEAARLGVGNAEAPKSIEMPSGGDAKLGKVTLTQEQRDIFGDKAGHLAHDILTPMVNSPGWAYMPDFVKQRAFKEVFAKANTFGKYEALTDVQRQQEIQRITTEIGKRLSQ